MIKNIQHIRRSQFVLTYGPGAIIESERGPRLIPSINQGLQDPSLSSAVLEGFEITDSRLRTILKNLRNTESRIFSLPSNAALGKPETVGIYNTYIFPLWKVCYGRRGNHLPVLYRKRKCPICNSDKDSSAVRFVVSCTRGHLDEVPWRFSVHRNCDHNCNPEYYYWKSQGSSLADIVIECPRCGCSTNMQEIYQTDFSCTARFPEHEFPTHIASGAPFVTTPERNPGKCDKAMKTLQRQSSSLRFPVTISLLTIPEYDNEISNILQRTDVESVVETIFNLAGEDITDESFMKGIKGASHISDDTGAVIEEHLQKNGVKWVRKLFNRLHSERRNFMDFIYEEFESLSSSPHVPTENFSVSRPVKVKDDHDLLPSLSVYPVEKLRTVTTQEAYIRTPYTEQNCEPMKVSSGVFVDDSFWYPGFEGMGEGLFITFDAQGPDFNNNPSYDAWRNEAERDSSEEIFGNPLWGNIPKQPLFVWLHTLSHSIMRALSIHSGYSSASLRERVYVDRNGENGGILIYTTSPGEDGSMGGLVGLVEQPEDVLNKAVDYIIFCSNDPLCGEARKIQSSKNGATCYSCLFASETSCEHRNMCLDRHIILSD